MVAKLTKRGYDYKIITRLILLPFASPVVVGPILLPSLPAKLSSPSAVGDENSTSFSVMRGAALLSHRYWVLTPFPLQSCRRSWLSNSHQVGSKSSQEQKKLKKDFKMKFLVRISFNCLFVRIMSFNSALSVCCISCQNIIES